MYNLRWKLLRVWHPLPLFRTALIVIHCNNNKKGKVLFSSFYVEGYSSLTSIKFMSLYNIDFNLIKLGFIFYFQEKGPSQGFRDEILFMRTPDILHGAWFIILCLISYRNYLASKYKKMTKKCKEEQLEKKKFWYIFEV